MGVVESIIEAVTSAQNGMFRDYSKSEQFVLIVLFLTSRGNVDRCLRLCSDFPFKIFPVN